MEKLLTFEEIDPVIKPYYETLIDALRKSFEDATKIKEYWAEKRELFVHLKPRSMGSTINDCLKSRLTTAFFENKTIRIIDKNFFGVLIDEKVFIRFNKMDNKFRTSIQKRKQFWTFYNQAELEGLPPSATLIWCGYLPDRGWMKLLGYFLVCYKGGLNWYYDMTNPAVQQTSVDEEIKQEKRRLTLKQKKQDKNTGDQLGNTGTDGIK